MDFSHIIGECLRKYDLIQNFGIVGTIIGRKKIPRKMPNCRIKELCNVSVRMLEPRSKEGSLQYRANFHVVVYQIWSGHR